jgi:type VI protein secretion system component VasK
MKPRTRAGLQLLVLLIVGVALMLLYPPALRFAEGAAREVRYLWWLILLVALAVWLIWGANRKPKD